LKEKHRSISPKSFQNHFIFLSKPHTKQHDESICSESFLWLIQKQHLTIYWTQDNMLKWTLFWGNRKAQAAIYINAMQAHTYRND